MPIPKPTSQIDWVPGEDVGKVTDPGAAKKALGWLLDERPPFTFMNWLFARIGNWQLYFESVTDEVFAKTLEYDAVVGAAAGATHATLQAAITAASSGWKILVLDDETINTRITVNVSDIEIELKKGVTFTKGTDTVCFETSSARVKITGGRFVGFTTGGDIVYKLLAGADYCQIRDSIFVVSTANEFDDSAVTAGKIPDILGTITEV